MRVLHIPAALAALALTATVALAAETTGTVKSIDTKAHSLTLSDGSVYALPAGFKDPGLKAGEKVKVIFDTKDGKHKASSVTIAK